MAFVRVARTDEILPGHTAFFYVGSTPVLLANVDNRIFAVHGLCPHRDNPLEGACLYGSLVDCPWHHFEYDVRTGENFYPRNVYPADMPHLEAQLRPLQTYPVEVRDSEVWVNIT
ncbi:MAG TPA: Rieske 2Fe-2S domain-containing protein [Bryobacteraceae bacterium]|nr:Rieske 2Fe-2S domain-containing protein [Bryobacteraceae bacterium]